MNIICPGHCIALFQRNADSLNILQGFWQRDDALRLEDFQTLQRTFDSWYFGFGSPAVAGFLETVADDTGGTTRDTSMHGFIREQIPDLLRISYTGPTSDIRSFAKEILLDLKTKKGFRIPHVQVLSPSFMISFDQIPHLDCIKEEPAEGDVFYTTYVLFREYWFQWGRLDNFIALMGFHPEYLECYVKIQAHLFHADLPLPYPDRHYLAVLAAAEQRCVYLVLFFARQFLASGGDPTWLQGIQHGPLKWRQLAGLNHDLAKQPWMVTATQIHNIIHGDDTRSRGETLSLSELMHAVAIMTHVHALSSFIFGCGVRPEIDQYESVCSLLDPVFQNNGSNEERTKPDPTSTHWHGTGTQGSPNSVSNGDSRPKHKVSGRGEEQLSPSTVSVKGTSSSDMAPATQLLKLIQSETIISDEVTEDVVAEQFIIRTHHNKELDSQIDPSSLTRLSELLTTLGQHPAIARFIDNRDFGYISFNDVPFHITEYCWPEEGYALADRLCTDLGTLLDDKFKNAYDLTYNTLNSLTDVDTTFYRRSVWNYVQSFFGICHDGFRYDSVDRLFNTSSRVFLKLCATRPIAVDPVMHSFEKIFPMLSASEVVHVILMVVEARQQACLLYALRSISECQARR